MKVDFELFYQDIIRNITPLPDDKKEFLKTKLRKTYDLYSKIKVPYKHRQTIQNLRNREDIIVLKQDKGRGVVILNKNTYTEKCLDYLNSPQRKGSNQSYRRKSSTTFTEEKFNNTFQRTVTRNFTQPLSNRF